MLSVNLRLHDPSGEGVQGDIFLFNHFARFETFIPQYLLYLETGTKCRALASAEFFDEDDAFSNYLKSVGAVPNDLPDLLPYLAAEVLRGRKLVIFPEGGMVKDRRVLDANGDYSVYSRTAERRRKQHTGAAVVALALATFKAAVNDAHARGDNRRIDTWAERLELPDRGALLAAARRPTLIIPANITFYPIRVDDNLLRRGAELLNRGLSRRLSEELLIEGNILLKHTDMDIRLGAAVRAEQCWRWWDRRLVARIGRRLGGLESVLALDRRHGPLDERLLAHRLRRGALRLRDIYMRRMYSGVTVNLSHLASCLVLNLLERGERTVALEKLRKILYLAVKRLQGDGSVRLHRSLRNPSAYGGLPEGDCTGLDQFLATAAGMSLVSCDATHCELRSKLDAEHGFDEIRIENLVEVYANEAAPIAAVRHAIDAAREQFERITAREFAALRFDDERRAYAWDRDAFTKARHAEINRAETATASAEPYLLLPEQPREPGVLLVHGFLASPAELRELGDRLYARGHPVMGVRLKGHGTSPWDLRERGWPDWLDSVRRGYAILGAYAPRICVPGFSTGGALALCLAAEHPAGLAGVAASSVPIKFASPGMVWVPIMHRANRLARRLSWSDGVMPFRVNESEHPDINYRNMPVRGLYELHLLVDELEARLPDVECPVALYQANADPVVVPESVERIAARLAPERTRVTMVESDRHGIVCDDIGGTQAAIIEFVTGLHAAEAGG